MSPSTRGQTHAYWTLRNHLLWLIKIINQLCSTPLVFLWLWNWPVEVAGAASSNSISVAGFRGKARRLQRGYRLAAELRVGRAVMNHIVIWGGGNIMVIVGGHQWTRATANAHASRRSRRVYYLRYKPVNRSRPLRRSAACNLSANCLVLLGSHQPRWPVPWGWILKGEKITSFLQQWNCKIMHVVSGSADSCTSATTRLSLPTSPKGGDVVQNTTVSRVATQREVGCNAEEADFLRRKQTCACLNPDQQAIWYLPECKCWAVHWIGWNVHVALMPTWTVWTDSDQKLQEQSKKCPTFAQNLPLPAIKLHVKQMSGIPKTFLTF